MQGVRIQPQLAEREAVVSKVMAMTALPGPTIGSGILLPMTGKVTLLSLPNSLDTKMIAIVKMVSNGKSF